MRTSALPAAIALSAMLLVAPGASLIQAQVTAGSIAGTVIDPSGRPIPGATVVASDGLHALSRTAVSDQAGRYRLRGPGSGTLRCLGCCPGFEPVERRHVPVAVDSQTRLDIHLPVAGIVQAVEVTAPLVPVQLESADLGAVIDQRRIQSLPLNRRDFLQLALLTPGVNPPAEGSELSSRGSFAMHANGGREEYNNFLLDGVDNNDAYVNRYVVQPPMDSIQEFKIATNSYSAEYGRSAAGQVNVITKSGSNRVELTAYRVLPQPGLERTQRLRHRGRGGSLRAQPVRREPRRAARPQPHLRVREHRLPARAALGHAPVDRADGPAALGRPVGACR